MKYIYVLEMDYKPTFANGFDFTEALDAFAPFIEREHPNYDPENKSSGMAFLDMKLFPEYLVHCFSHQEFWNVFEDYFEQSKRSPQASTDIRNMKHYSGFSSVNFPERNFTHNTDPIETENGFETFCPNKNKPIRKQKIYPLSYDETERSIEFIQRNIDYELAMVTIKMCIVDYLLAITDSCNEKFDCNFYERSAETESEAGLKNAYSRLLTNAMGFSFLQDFMPLIANTLCMEEAPYETKSLQKAVRDIFKRQAFISSIEDMGAQHCPFAKSLIDILRLKLEINDDGTHNVSENNHHGTLILSVRDIIRENYIQAIPDGHPIHDIRAVYGHV